MARKYVCDNCGAIFNELWTYDSSEREHTTLWTVSIVRADADKPYYGNIGEYCEDCKDALLKIIKESWRK